MRKTHLLRVLLTIVLLVFLFRGANQARNS
jgi:hypothetical protein